MNTLLTYLLGCALLLVSCGKDDSCKLRDSGAVASAGEISYLQDYMTSHSISASQHNSGIFYELIQPGAGSAPGVCNSITINYSGSLLSNGTVFDSQQNISFLLGQLIVGWQKGLPLIKPGGSIVLYIPPSLGYGSADVTQNGVVVIPGNSYLKFNISLLDVR